MLPKLQLSLNVGQNCGQNTYLLMHETKEQCMQCPFSRPVEAKLCHTCGEVEEKNACSMYNDKQQNLYTPWWYLNTF